MGASGWPFWAATSDEAIDRALELADLQPGERFVDLGCGDGRVLVRAAAQRGARVHGVEADPRMAAQARHVLAAGNVDGDVVEADFAEVDIGGDVVFAYLSPATLQRLRARLGQLPDGTRVVTFGYAIPGWQPTRREGRSYLYRLPVQPSEVDRDRRGWATAGILVTARPHMPSLVAAALHHGGGDVHVDVTGDLTAEAVHTGADVAAPGDVVVVDVRLDPHPAGTTVAAVLSASGMGSLRYVAHVDDGEPGVWGIAESGLEEVDTALRAGSVAGLVARARYQR